MYDEPTRVGSVSALASDGRSTAVSKTTTSLIGLSPVPIMHIMSV